MMASSEDDRWRNMIVYTDFKETLQCFKLVIARLIKNKITQEHWKECETLSIRDLGK